MSEAIKPRIFVALVHYPVLNKQGDIVTSSVTTLDVHDMSRICRTFAVETFFVVTPLESQHQLVERMVAHWMKGFGSRYNPTRKEALTSTMVVKNIQEAGKKIEEEVGRAPRIVVPDAKPFPQSVTYDEARLAFQQDEGPYLILFGTGWGLERNMVKRADMILAPIDGINGYNHLPVRAATAIILDRLLIKRHED
ncbi:MAG: RNA methyltransferase [Candidatus Nitronauta litoralis]|uniref:RNA methyltransferase n=1 Tax=Candidatus Nitronauta litoralis TaxID=2705533 RepID=A0A7T0BW11_9BACT|nr:MAG: RNA methyltransferase [Candidatus Nitronauta litoralis]